jgi:hypothetical protein
MCGNWLSNNETVQVSNTLEHQVLTHKTSKCQTPPFDAGVVDASCWSGDQLGLPYFLGWGNRVLVAMPMLVA